MCMAYNAQFDLRGKKIQDTYSQVLQYDTSSNVSYTGQGSSFNLSSSNAVTASFAQIAALANNATSASYAPAVPSLSSSWASASFVASSASFASQSISSSFAVSSSWAPVGVQVSSSWSSASFVAESSSFASQSISSSFAISASWAPDQTVSVNSASWASSSISSSYLKTSGITGSEGTLNIRYNTGGNGLYLNDIDGTDSPGTRLLCVAPNGFVAYPSWVDALIIYDVAFDGRFSGSFTGSYTGSLFGTSSWARNALSVTSASWASASLFSTSSSFASRSISASYAPQVEQISASWASASLSSSYTDRAVSASIADRLIGSGRIDSILSYVDGVGTVFNTKAISAGIVFYASTWPGTSITMSSDGVHGDLVGTASWAVSASWAPDQTVTVNSASWASASFFATSASFASRSISASFASRYPIIAGILTTRSFTQDVDDGWGIATASGSGIQLGEGFFVYIDGVAVFSENVETSKSFTAVGGVTGSLVGTASWSSNSLFATSASFASRSISASYAPQFEQISASWASASFVATSASFASRSISSSNAVTASWVPNLYPQTEQISASWASASFVADSASFASRSISASYAPQFEQISASWASASFFATSASFASRSISSSYSSGSFVQDGNAFGQSASLGTTDNFSLVLKANNTQSLFVNTNGRVSIGTGSATRTLHVVGNGILSERVGATPQLVLRNGNDWGFSVGTNGSLQTSDMNNGNINALTIQSASIDGLVTLNGSRVLIGNGGHLSSSVVTASIYAPSSIEIPYSSSLQSLTPETRTGSMYFETVNNLLYIYNGSSWKSSSFV